jgi:hypothetical protein
MKLWIDDTMFIKKILSSINFTVKTNIAVDPKLQYPKPLILLIQDRIRSRSRFGAESHSRMPIGTKPPTRS